MSRQVVNVGISAVGAVVGFYVGGPQGAMWGWQIGSMVGSAVNPATIQGPRIGDIAQQTAQEGGPRPIVFAMSPPIPGNVIFSGEPRIVRRRRRQGKGGPRVETESVYRTYAIGVCEGPITGFWRIWRNGVLVYDVSDDSLLTEAENNEFLESARLFLGEFTQEPSPDIESLFSPAPAHRGTAYMVQADEDLTDLRGMIPQYTFQVIRCEGVFRTSRPYPIEELDALGSSVSVPAGSLVTPPGPTIITTTMDAEGFDSVVELAAGELRDPLQTLENTEGFDSVVELAAGELRVGLHVLEPDAEGFDSVVELPAGALSVVLISYEPEPEGFDSSVELIAGSLE